MFKKFLRDPRFVSGVAVLAALAVEHFVPEFQGLFSVDFFVGLLTAVLTTLLGPTVKYMLLGS